MAGNFVAGLKSRKLIGAGNIKSLYSFMKDGSADG